MRVPFAPCLFVCGLVLSASVAADDKNLEGDLAKLQGRWTATVGAEGMQPMTMEIKGDELAILVTTFQGRGYALKGQIKLDGSSSTKAKAMDWTKLAVNGKEGPDVLAIYELDGDTLKVCSAGPGKERPASMATENNANGSPSRNLVFKREKEESKDATKTSSR
jgi:uncharacterized protein (TIGR03067 family)